MTDERTQYWFVLDEGEYVDLQPATDGILRSRVFPGLSLAPSAFWANDLATMLAVPQQGIASPEHRASVETLASVTNTSSSV